jgi:hypothetical protein
MTRLRAGAVLAFLLLGGWVSLVAQTHFASFTGTISSKDGNPVPNVEVTATEMNPITLESGQNARVNISMQIGFE